MNYVPTTILNGRKQSSGGKFPLLTYTSKKEKKKKQSEEGREEGKRTADNYNVK